MRLDEGPELGRAVPQVRQRAAKRRQFVKKPRIERPFACCCTNKGGEGMTVWNNGQEDG